MSELYIGIISGTSLDAVDVACIRVAEEKIQFVNAIAVAIPGSIQQQCRDLIKDKHADFITLLELDVKLGHLFAKAIQQLLQESKLTANDIKAVGSHGQTIYHHPDSQYRSTLQLGDPNVIAEQTGMTVVADLRRRDMAAGGQGAPLVPIFHNMLSKRDKTMALVNIGGIANITCQDKAGQTVGYDTGPGNGLMDAYCRAYLNQSMDKNGAQARTGKINKDLLSQFLSDNYFSLPIPKSTGTEYFNLAWLESFLTAEHHPSDILATLTELTALTITNALATPEIKNVYLCGGGVHNTFLCQRIRHLLTGVTVLTTSELGIHPDWIEACAFAYLAHLTLSKKPGNVTSVTGAKKEVILGGIYQAG